MLLQCFLRRPALLGRNRRTASAYVSRLTGVMTGSSPSSRQKQRIDVLTDRRRASGSEGSALIAAASSARVAGAAATQEDLADKVDIDVLYLSVIAMTLAKDGYITFCFFHTQN
jgi:hypothetical protein